MVREITNEEQLWLALSDAESELADATKKIFDLTCELRKYKLVKEKS